MKPVGTWWGGSEARAQRNVRTIKATIAFREQTSVELRKYFALSTVESPASELDDSWDQLGEIDRVARIGIGSALATLRHEAFKTIWQQTRQVPRQSRTGLTDSNVDGHRRGHLILDVEPSLGSMHFGLSLCDVSSI